MLASLFICIAWVISLCLHEFGHAVVAYWGGDKSVKDKGYLTLNPLKYTDPGLSLIMPIVFLMLGGIALPGAAVYINRRALRNRFWHSAVSFAGPFMSSIVAAVLALPFFFDLAPHKPTGWFWPCLAFLVILQIVGVLLNSLPIPPLDGYGVIEPWLPTPLRNAANNFGRYGILLLFGLFWFVQPASDFLWLSAFIIAAVLGVPPKLVEVGYNDFKAQRSFLVVILLAVAFIYRAGIKKRSPAAVEAPPEQPH